jgi:hypothetical protein
MKVKYSYETSVDFQRTTQHYEDRYLDVSKCCIKWFNLCYETMNKEILLHIHGLFNDTVSIINYIALNGKSKVVALVN